MGEDDWKWHMYDTVKGADWLGDQDAIEYLCKEAPQAVYELEHFGLPFSRREDGKIYQRPFGGMTTHYGEGIAQRTCAAADRTGHAMLHTLYGKAISNSAEFFIEYFAIDLIMDKMEPALVVALCLEDGTIHRFQAENNPCHRWLWTRLFFSNICTLMHGRWKCYGSQSWFTITGYGICSVSSNGNIWGWLLNNRRIKRRRWISTNSEGERFMERYAPSAKDLASRDVMLEIHN